MAQKHGFVAHDAVATERRVAVFKALGHETRVRMVEILAREGEKCVCELVERLGFDQSTISKHLAVLKAAGVVASRKEGLNVVYRLRTPCVYQFIRCIDQMAEDAECALVCSGIAAGPPAERTTGAEL
ncbi:MAG: winged helix-turn-helix transcriptional regulator [Firmicutes bacterium]|nr:winged helix-turn-helix transcriptional regulator [Bacillota bacterium]